MDLNQLDNTGKMRIVQELVPGKQITIAHVIANPDQRYPDCDRHGFRGGDRAQGAGGLRPGDLGLHGVRDHQNVGGAR